MRLWRPGAIVAAEPLQAEGAVPPPHRRFLEGMFVALTNPKAILFFTALFPQFVVPGVPALRQFFVLTTTFALCSLVAHACWVGVGHGARVWLADARASRWVDRVFGGTFVVLGVSLLRLKARIA